MAWRHLHAETLATPRSLLRVLTPPLIQRWLAAPREIVPLSSVSQGLPTWVQGCHTAWLPHPEPPEHPSRVKNSRIRTGVCKVVVGRRQSLTSLFSRTVSSWLQSQLSCGTPYLSVWWPSILPQEDSRTAVRWALDSEPSSLTTRPPPPPMTVGAGSPEASLQWFTALSLHLSLSWIYMLCLSLCERTPSLDSLPFCSHLKLSLSRVASAHPSAPSAHSGRGFWPWAWTCQLGTALWSSPGTCVLPNLWDKIKHPSALGSATHSSILAWRIPWTEEPGGLQSMGLPRVRLDWVAFIHFSLALWVPFSCAFPLWFVTEYSAQFPELYNMTLVYEGSCLLILPFPLLTSSPEGFCREESSCPWQSCNRSAPGVLCGTSIV